MRRGRAAAQEGEPAAPAPRGRRGRAAAAADDADAANNAPAAAPHVPGAGRGRGRGQPGRPPEERGVADANGVHPARPRTWIKLREELVLDEVTPEGRLTAACLRGERQMAERLFEEGTNIDGIPQDPSAVTVPLIGAVYGNDVAMVKWVLDSGADVNRIDEQRCAAIHYAASLGHVDVMKLLLDYGADRILNSRFGAVTDVSLKSQQPEAGRTNLMYHPPYSIHLHRHVRTDDHFGFKAKARALLILRANQVPPFVGANEALMVYVLGHLWRELYRPGGGVLRLVGAFKTNRGFPMPD